MPSKDEADRARAWRNKLGWSMDKLSELTGYSVSSIWWFERGQSPPPRGSDAPGKINVYSWQRYKRCCHSVAVEQRAGKQFDWGA